MLVWQLPGWQGNNVGVLGFREPLPWQQQQQESSVKLVMCFGRSDPLTVTTDFWAHQCHVTYSISCKSEVIWRNRQLTTICICLHQALTQSIQRTKYSITQACISNNTVAFMKPLLEKLINLDLTPSWGMTTIFLHSVMKVMQHWYKHMIVWCDKISNLSSKLQDLKYLLPHHNKSLDICILVPLQGRLYPAAN